jgi:hypothetical protein
MLLFSSRWCLKQLIKESQAKSMMLLFALRSLRPCMCVCVFVHANETCTCAHACRCCLILENIHACPNITTVRRQSHRVLRISANLAHVCIYIYICIHIHTYIHTYIYTHIYIYMYTVIDFAHLWSTVRVTWASSSFTASSVARTSSSLLARAASKAAVQHGQT